MTHFPIHARIHAEYRHASGVMRITHTPDKGKTKYDPTKPSLIFNLNKVQRYVTSSNCFGFVFMRFVLP